jgi:hypothetical protein
VQGTSVKVRRGYPDVEPVRTTLCISFTDLRRRNDCTMTRGKSVAQHIVFIILIFHSVMGVTHLGRVIPHKGAEKSVDKIRNQDVHKAYYNNIFFNHFFIYKKRKSRER